MAARHINTQSARSVVAVQVPKQPVILKTIKDTPTETIQFTLGLGLTSRQTVQKVKQVLNHTSEQLQMHVYVRYQLTSAPGNTQLRVYYAQI